MYSPSVRKAAYFKLWKTVSVRPKYLDKKCYGSAHFCLHPQSTFLHLNFLLAGLPSQAFAHLQRIVNHAARLFSEISRRDYITPLFNELHWLSVKYRTESGQTRVPPFQKTLYLSLNLNTYELFSDPVTNVSFLSPEQTPSLLANVLSSFKPLNGLAHADLAKNTRFFA